MGCLRLFVLRCDLLSMLSRCCSLLPAGCASAPVRVIPLSAPYSYNHPLLCRLAEQPLFRFFFRTKLQT